MHIGQAVQPGGLYLAEFVPSGVYPLENPQTDIPRIARDTKLTQLIDAAVQRIPTTHMLNLGDAREMSELAPASIHLVLTSATLLDF